MRPKIEFIQLSTDKQSNINNIICRLCYENYQNKRNIYILCPNQNYLLQLDEHIINYQSSYFFPYNIYGEGPIPPANIVVGIDTPTNLKYDILINLHSIIPDNFIKYKNIYELVSQKQEYRKISREHYKHYQKYNLDIDFIQDDIELNRVKDNHG